MILRLTGKLAKKVGTNSLTEMPLDENPLVDWSCHLFSVKRTQYLIVSNTKTLYSCFLYGRSISNDSVLISRLLDILREVLGDDGYSEVYQEVIAPSSATVALAKSLNRSVTSSINQLLLPAELHLDEGDLAPHEVGFRVNGILLSALASEKSPGYGTPEEAFRDLVEARSG